jgi:hypothetical protein
MSASKDGNWGKIALLNGAVSAWLIYDMATAAEAPSPALKILQYVILAGCLVGLVAALSKLAARRSA